MRERKLEGKVLKIAYKKVENKKHVIIIGAAKAGTSTLMEHMSEHDNVNTSAGKEPRYFCDGYYEEYLGEGVKYRDLWEDDDGHVYLEASTGYTKHPAVSGAAENMLEYGIDPKLIYLVRDPLKRMISHVEYVIWREEGINIDYLRESCVTASMYYTQSKRYVDRFGREKVNIIKLSEMSEKPKKTINEVFEFIDEEYTGVVENRRENVSRNVTKFELLVRKSSVWEFRSLVPQAVKEGVRDIWSLFSESPYKDVIDEIEKRKIREMCRDALRLEDLFDVDLDAWRESISRSELLK